MTDVLDRARWQRLSAILDQAFELPPAARARMVEEWCAGDRALQAEVDELLAAAGAPDDFLAGTAAEQATPLIEHAGVGARPLRIGQTIGAYRLVRELGEGGMGVVYLAERADGQFVRHVAIKIVHAGPPGDEIVRRFSLERQILASLEHANIARLLDGGVTDAGQPYLVMDYVEGIPIDQYCDRRRLPIADRLRLFQAVCAAVDYAHQNLVVHRDLKPANMLVTDDAAVKLLDFGIAKLLRPDPSFEGRGLTVTGVHFMTPEYASPEQVRSEPIGTFTDVYALGVLLYVLLTGRPPYRLQDLGTQEMVRVICEDEPLKPSLAVGREESRAGRAITPDAVAAVREGRPERLRRRLEGDLDIIVQTALRKEVSRRYATVAQLGEDIRRHLDGLPIQARRDTLRYRTSKFVRRHRIAVAAAILITVTLAAGVVATAREARIADRRRQEAEAQKARAERRFNDVRRLADSFLFEFDGAIASLPGSTPARKLVVSKALEYLDSLAGESSGDAGLQRELAAAYDKVGDVQGNWFLPNLGDVKGSTASYQKAYAIRAALVKAAPSDPASEMLMAVSLRNLGDGAFSAGDPAGAVGQYRRAAAIGDRLLAARPGDETFRRAVTDIDQRLCNTLMLIGDVAGATARCQRYSVEVDGLLRKDPDDLKLLMGRANSATMLGNALLNNGHPDQARESLQAGERWFDEVLSRDPNNATARRGQAMCRTRLANTLSALGEMAGAVVSYQRAVDALQNLVAADPGSARFKTDLAYTLLRRVTVLLKAGRPLDARRSAAAGLTLLRAQADRKEASASDWNDYAFWLVTCDPPELRDPPTALQFARRAVAASSPPNPSFLHTLGWAEYRTGSPEKAVATLEEALRLLDPASAVGPARGLRAQIEHDLKEFRARRVH